MQWKATETNWQQPEVGNWPATCIRVIDLGTQEREYQGETSYRRQTLIIWELNGQNDKDGKPITISKAYTASLGDKANLRKDLESWRGRPFTADELAGFEVRNILGKPCLLNLIKVQGRKGEKVVIASVSALPRSMPPPPAPINSQYIFDLEAPDPSVWEQLSDGLKGWINRSQERSRGAEQPTSTTLSRLTAQDDDIPF